MHKKLVSNNPGEPARLQPFPTDRVAALHLIDGRLRGRKPRISPAITKLDKQPSVARATEMTLPEVTAVCPRRNVLILQRWFLLVLILYHIKATHLSLCLTSSIPATCSGIPPIRPIQRITPKSGGSFTSTIDPTSSSPSGAAPPSSPTVSLPSGNLSGEGESCRPLTSSGSGSDVRPGGLGGGRGGRGLAAGFGGGKGGGFSACLVGGIRAILDVEADSDVGGGLVAGGTTGFRMGLLIW